MRHMPMSESGRCIAIANFKADGLPEQTCPNPTNPRESADLRSSFVR